MKLLVRRQAFQRVGDSAFGHHNELGGLRGDAPVNDRARRSDEVSHGEYIARTFGMRGNKRVWMRSASGRQLARGKGRVHDAGALPDLHVFPAGLLLYPIAEVNIRQEQDRLFADRKSV